jgi:hypothetical protein
LVLADAFLTDDVLSALQHFMDGQPQALVQTPFAGSQQDLSALQHPGMLQQGPLAQQFPLAQQTGAEAPTPANTGLQPRAATARPAKKRFLSRFIWFLLTVSQCKAQRR